MQDDPLVRCFDHLVRRAPSAAVVATPGRTWSRAALDAMARAAARALAEDPSPAPTPVALQATGGPAFLAGLLAVRRAGRPAILLDAGTPAAARRSLARHLGFATCLMAATPWPGAAGWRLERTARISAPPANPAWSTAGVIKITSGSTGTPRGIATPTEALLADDEALTSTMGLQGEDRLLAAVPFSHSYGLSSLAVPALRRGTLLVMPEGDRPLAPLAAATACGATVFPTVPAFVGALVRLAEPAPAPDCLRLVVAAGAPLSGEVAARFRARYGRPVHVFYGASECGGICYDRTGTAAEEGTVGEPVAGVRVELAPPAGGKGVPASRAGKPAGGDAGRVVVHSSAVAAGYLPAADAALARGRFASQDRGRWVGRALRLDGRLDDVINVRGHKVDPAEVERVLAALDAVEEAAVVGLPAPGGGAGGVHAVVACPAATLTVEQVLAWCREHLTEYKVPRTVRLVRHLPRTARGKVDREGLRAGHA